MSVATTTLENSLSDSELTRFRQLDKLVVAAKRLARASLVAIAASRANGQADIRVVSDKRLASLRDRHEKALKDERYAEHEVHCLAVELGLAEPDMSRYGQWKEDHTFQHDTQWGYRRYPANVKKECLGNCTDSCHCNA